LKNDLIKSKADWDRERKKMIADHENELNMVKTQAEDEFMEELK